MTQHASKPRRRMQIFVGSLFIIGCVIGGYYVIGYHPGEVEPENPLNSSSQTNP
ncbi:hypothetical protein [Agrobacterium vitis]|uniref:hypothetical protein n=1 Tax=Agrobacterium vitis TaxID=373 RepID=UPI001573F562|nr:hypothetical protein [Agrobacterium vitis]NSY14543.1 hypothetical protein [Agrobacterium vitis]NSY24300.1 hypothetical protein [Agrobacterium vitis]WEO74101.1 hypothetical protein G6L01_022555 [Agrobacterium vitis]